MLRIVRIGPRLNQFTLLAPVWTALAAGLLPLLLRANAEQAAPPPPATTSPSTQPTTPPASRPTQSPLAHRVDALVTQLGDREYRRREAAQQELAALGSAALPLLIQRVPNPDAEINDRLITLIGTPAALAHRIEFATRLLETADPDHMERAVYLLFDDPVAACEPFKLRVRDATGAMAAMCAPIIEQLDRCRASDQTTRAHVEKIRRKSPEKAAETLRKNKEGYLYNAEAAYWSAVEALAAHIEQEASRPAGGAAATQRTVP